MTITYVRVRYLGCFVCVKPLEVFLQKTNSGYRILIQDAPSPGVSACGLSRYTLRFFAGNGQDGTEVEIFGHDSLYQESDESISLGKTRPGRE